MYLRKMIVRFTQAIADGIDVNMRHPLGWTALHIASMNQKPEIIKVLLDSGVDVNADDHFANVYRTAKEKSLHPLDGTYVTTIITSFRAGHCLRSESQ